VTEFELALSAWAKPAGICGRKIADRPRKQWLTCKYAERVTRIELALSAWEVCGATRVLPAESVTCRDHDGLSVSDRDYPRVLLPSGTQRARPDPRIKRKTRPSSKPSSPSVLLAPPHSSCSTWCGEVRCCVMALLLALLLLGTAADMPTVYKLAAAPASMAAELRSGRVCRRRAGGLFR